MAILVSCAACGRQFRVKEQFRGTKLKCPGCKTEALVHGPHVCGYDAFISYSSKDSQVADAVCAAMESKGVRCWIAPRDIAAGASWGASIIDGIEDSRVLVLVFSAQSNQSDQVLREVERAVAKKVPVVPLRIDGSTMAKGLEYFLGACHWLDATNGPLEKHLAQLTSTVRAMLLERAQTEVAPLPPTASAPPQREVAAVTPPAPPPPDSSLETRPEASAPASSFPVPPERRLASIPLGTRMKVVGAGFAAALLVIAAGVGYAIHRATQRPAYASIPAGSASNNPAVAKQPAPAPSTDANKSQAYADAGWVDLFNGKNLSGWKVGEHADTFKVQDGAIVVDGQGPAHLFYDGPVHDHDFKNFHLKAEVMTFPHANSGIYFHTTYQQSGWPSQGFEAQVNQTHPDPKKTGSLYLMNDVMNVPPAEDNKWFTYDIIVEGKHVVLRIDGKTTTDWTEPTPPTPPRNLRGRFLQHGTIALQGHDSGSKVLFKSVKIKVLPE